MARCQPFRGRCCPVFWVGELTGCHPWAGAAAEDLCHLPPGLTVIGAGFQREESGFEGALSPTRVPAESRPSAVLRRAGPPACSVGVRQAGSAEVTPRRHRNGRVSAKRGLKYIFRALPNQSLKEL